MMKPLLCDELFMGSPAKLMVQAPLEPIVLLGIVLGPRYSQLAPLTSSLIQSAGIPFAKFSCQMMLFWPVVKKYNEIKEKVSSDLYIVFIF